MADEVITVDEVEGGMSPDPASNRAGDESVDDLLARVAAAKVQDSRKAPATPHEATDDHADLMRKIDDFLGNYDPADGIPDLPRILKEKPSLFELLDEWALGVADSNQSTESTEPKSSGRKERNDDERKARRVVASDQDSSWTVELLDPTLVPEERSPKRRAKVQSPVEQLLAPQVADEAVAAPAKEYREKPKATKGAEARTANVDVYPMGFDEVAPAPAVSYLPPDSPTIVHAETNLDPAPQPVRRTFGGTQVILHQGTVIRHPNQ